eukprot:TRINITY_DN38118_c0_g1_i1.p1 TRINITY_DN38118_c0_g1~~TRINITY_DN38118_c0_g1_i1.p1  ORF type:complete len:1499 (-),score=409.54 TRINITY_DN38118_c0_g1_i1:243-4739(-)
MDVYVSILDAKNLSQSALIARSLCVTLEIGDNVQKFTKVTVQDARFTASDAFPGGGAKELLISLQTRLSQTVMFVARVSLAGLSLSSAPSTTWVPVYEPSDAGLRSVAWDGQDAPPKSEWPQVLLSLRQTRSVHPTPEVSLRSPPLSVASLAASLSRVTESRDTRSGSPQEFPAFVEDAFPGSLDRAQSKLAKAEEELQLSIHARLSAETVKKELLQIAREDEAKPATPSKVWQVEDKLDRKREELEGLQKRLKAGTEDVQKVEGSIAEFHKKIQNVAVRCEDEELSQLQQSLDGAMNDWQSVRSKRNRLIERLHAQRLLLQQQQQSLEQAAQTAEADKEQEALQLRLARCNKLATEDDRLNLLQQEHEREHANLRSAEERVKECCRAVDAQQTLRRGLEASLEAASDTLQRDSCRSDESKRGSDDLQAEVARLRARAVELDAERQASEQQHAAAIVEEERRLEALRGEREKHISDLRLASQEVERMQVAACQVLDRQQACQVSANAASADIVALQQETLRLEAELKSVSADNEYHEVAEQQVAQNIKALQEECQGKQADIDRMEAVMEEMRQGADMEKTSLREREGMLARQLEQFQQQTIGLQAALAQQLQHAETLTAQRGGSENLHQGLQSKVSELRIMASSMQRDLVGKLRALDGSRDNLTDREAVRNRASQRAQQSREELSSAQAGLEAVRSIVASAAGVPQVRFASATRLDGINASLCGVSVQCQEEMDRHASLQARLSKLVQEHKALAAANGGVKERIGALSIGVPLVSSSWKTKEPEQHLLLETCEHRASSLAELVREQQHLSTQMLARLQVDKQACATGLDAELSSLAAAAYSSSGLPQLPYETAKAAAEKQWDRISSAEYNRLRCSGEMPQSLQRIVELKRSAVVSEEAAAGKAKELSNAMSNLSRCEAEHDHMMEKLRIDSTVLLERAVQATSRSRSLNGSAARMRDVLEAELADIRHLLATNAGLPAFPESQGMPRTGTLDEAEHAALMRDHVQSRRDLLTAMARDAQASKAATSNFDADRDRIAGNPQGGKRGKLEGDIEALRKEAQMLHEDLNEAMVVLKNVQTEKQRLTETNHKAGQEPLVLLQEEARRWQQQAAQVRNELKASADAMKREHAATEQRMQIDLERKYEVASGQLIQESGKRPPIRPAATRATGSTRAAAARPSVLLEGLVSVPHSLETSIPATSSSALGTGRRRALIVGSNCSRLPWGGLRGCASDAWNLQCLLRHSMQYAEDQVRCLVDSSANCRMPESQEPTLANIVAGLAWLVKDARPGDSLLFAFSGFATQQSCPEELCYLPSDFAADLPEEFLLSLPDLTARAPAPYRLLRYSDIQSVIMALPRGCKMTLLLDTAGSPPSAAADRGGTAAEDCRLRWLALPAPAMQQPVTVFADGDWERNLRCTYHCFSAVVEGQRCVELNIEGTTQGAFTWAFVKSLLACNLSCSLRTHSQVLYDLMQHLRKHVTSLDQEPMLQIGGTAQLEDTVLLP